jgi:DNA-binding response OmpR family regulator
MIHHKAGMEAAESHTILVADDEDDIRKLVQFGLERDGHRVVMAADGAGALEAARTELPALCVLDVMMPKLSGLEVLQQLREDPRTAGIRVILLTARGREADVDRGFELGADDYVTKPFSPQELRRRVRAVLGR